MLEVEIGKQNDRYALRYIPPKRSIKEPRPVGLNNLQEENLYTVLRGLKETYKELSFKELKGTTPLTEQEINDITSRL